MMQQVATRIDRQVAVVAAPFGAMAVETESGHVRALRFLPPTPEVAPSNDLGVEAVEQLKRYFADPGFRFDLPLDIRGSAFQCRVWDAISAIPSGTTRRYGELAADLGAPARAVGQACGDNRLPIVIPCHRVIGADSLGGFAHASSGFSLSVKRWLLEHEGALRGTLI
jgi:methylated-DNA-[protein]-cysteine S-methyltransferase